MKINTQCSESVRTKTIGYRFHPTDAELVGHFLNRKIFGNGNGDNMPISEITVCDFEPWDLPALSKIKSDNQTWYFFCSRDLKYSNSRRIKRTTNSGQWKSTGKQRQVKGFGSKKIIGTKTSLVFYENQEGHRQKIRTQWVMHEYEHIAQGNFVLCKVKNKSVAKISRCVPIQNEMVSTPESSVTTDSSFGQRAPTSHASPHSEQLNVEGKQSEDEELSSSTCNESELCQHRASDADETPFCKVKSYFISQNSGQRIGPLVPKGCEWSPLVAKLDCASDQDPHEKTEFSNPSVAAGLEINAIESSLLEVQGLPTFFDDLKTLSEPESILSSLHSRL